MLEILQNKYIIIPILGWLTAQIIKIVSYVFKDKRIDFRHIMASGGMPSSHTSFVVSFTTTCARLNGLNSFEFGVGCIISLIVMYDAAGVRRQAGVHAEILNKIMYEHKKIGEYSDELKELLGHTPLQVLGGAILGITIGILLT